MMKLEITLTLTSAAQLDAIHSALEIYVDMETDRSKDKDSGFNIKAGSEDMVRLEAARTILNNLSGRKVV